MKKILASATLLVFPMMMLAQTPPQAPKEPAAGDTTAPKELSSAGSQQADSPLVRAAKASRAAKKPSKVVLNNADVKKSKGKLIFISGKPLAKPAETPARSLPEQKPLPRTDSVAETARKLDVARKEVADLEKELKRLEDDFYDEDDPAYRQSVIQTRFEQAKRQLEQARKKLLDAREQQQRLEQAAPPPYNP